MKKRLQHFIGALVVLGSLMAGYIYFKDNFDVLKDTIKISVSSNNAEENYSEEVKRAANEFDLPYPYLMSLIGLECGGKKPAGSRYEKHVFKRLQEVRDGKRTNYENVTRAHLSDASDEALKNLATSWGPFQLMGYKCILLGVKIKDIRGDNSVIYGAKWIDLAYGEKLRKGLYKDCFHIHNTGRSYPSNGQPTTHDPRYVSRGIAGMKKYQDASE